MLDDRAKKILFYWFGRVEKTLIPTEDRARIWFGDNQEVDQEIIDQFTDDLEKAAMQYYTGWENTPRGQLALIIVLDQFSRHIYRNQVHAFTQDEYALRLCTQGMEAELDHNLSLIERVFYYFPLIHSEDIAYQTSSINAYSLLRDLALPETKVIYESFFKFATHHYSIVQRFGRFPQRNAILGRESTDEEKKYLST